MKWFLLEANACSPFGYLHSVPTLCSASTWKEQSILQLWVTSWVEMLDLGQLLMLWSSDTTLWITASLNEFTTFGLKTFRPHTVPLFPLSAQSVTALAHSLPPTQQIKTPCSESLAARRTLILGSGATVNCLLLSSLEGLEEASHSMGNGFQKCFNLP